MSRLSRLRRVAYPWSFLVTAFVLHLAAYIALRTWKAAPSPPALSSAEPERDVVVDVVEGYDEVPRGAEPAAASIAPSRSRESTPRGKPPEAATPARGPADADGTGARGAASDEEPPTAGSAWSFSATQPHEDVTSRAFMARALQPTGKEEGGSAPRPAAGGIAEALDDHDTSVGITRGGPFVTALEDAAASSTAPFEGKATFDVAVDREGHVFATLLDSSGDAEAWRRVGSAAGASVDPKTLRIPPGSRGWHSVVTLEARIRFPNGLDPKTLGTTVAASPTGVTVTSIGKVCSVRVTIGLTLSPIAGNCDPTNIGAHPLRLVRARIDREGRF